MEFLNIYMYLSILLSSIFTVKYLGKILSLVKASNELKLDDIFIDIFINLSVMDKFFGQNSIL